MLMRQRSPAHHPLQPQPPISPEATAQAGTTNPNILVTHGIYRGQYPIGGLTVREARQVLERLLPIAADAIPVINGQPVDENQRINADVSLLSFVKPSSLRGAGDRITIEGREACLTGQQGEPLLMPVDDFSRRVTNATLQGLDDLPLPDNVRWMVQCGNVKVCVFELRPELRWIQWIAKDSPATHGPEATTDPRCLATPYVVVKVPFQGDRLLGRIEVFYRSEPLRSLDGDGGALFIPNLLNLSPWSHECVCWYCTQYVDFASLPPGIAEGLHFVANFVFSGKLNFSSEANEGQSGFSLSCAKGIDPRVTDVDRWQAASLEDPKFVLSVPWVPTGVTVRELILRELKFLKAKPAPASAAELGNLMHRKAKPR